MRPKLPDRFTLRTLLLGLILRLLLMPFTAHSDLMQFYWSSHLFSHHQRLVGFQVVLQSFHAGYLRLISALLPPADKIWVHLQEAYFTNPFAGQEVSSLEAWFAFVSHPQVFRSLFFLKLPYLIFDLACFLLIFRLGADRMRTKRMVYFWWFNPILIFAVYVFGRHEVVAIFFVLLCIYWIKVGKYRWSLFALGLAVAIRYYAVFLLPFFVFSMIPTWKKRVLSFIAGITPWLIVNMLGWSLSGSIDARGLASLPHNNYLLAMKFQIASWDNLYVFPLLYFLLLLHRVFNREQGLLTFARYSLAALLLLFATAYTGQSPHYWTWFLPFLTIVIVEDHRLLPLHYAQIVFLIGYSFIGGRSTAGYLLAPLAPEFFWSLPSPVELLGRFTSVEAVISMSRTALSALTFWMAYLVFRRIKTDLIPDTYPEEEVL